MIDAQAERELSCGLRSGNADAWRRLYDAFAEPVWRFVVRLMGPAGSDVSDVVQETFLAAARGAQMFDPERGTIWVWLCGIARNHVALHYRRQEQRQRLQHAAAWLARGNGRVFRALEAERNAPADALDAAELATLVRATLTQLSDEYGSLLARRYLDDVPVEQIASDEQSTSTAVRSRLARARRAFREVFVKYSDASSFDFAGEPHEA